MNNISTVRPGVAKNSRAKSRVINTNASSNKNLQTYMNSALEKAQAKISRLEDEIGALEQK